tara:strand:+ start:571 stop:753 length:183 start_codon:yes stop_codon:yes gene_type:complete
MYNFIKRICSFRKTDKVFRVTVPKNLDDELAETLRQLDVSESEIKLMEVSRNRLVDREET